MTDSPLQFSPKVVLVTGGAGFIGTNFVRLVLQSAEAKVVVFDSLTYAGNLPNLDGLAEDYKDRLSSLKVIFVMQSWSLRPWSKSASILSFTLPLRVTSTGQLMDPGHLFRPM